MDQNLNLLERLLRSLGVSRIRKGDWIRYLEFPSDFSDAHVDLHRQVERFTLTRPERTFALVEAVRYLCEANISGSFVECGVWRGGSVMAMAYSLSALNAQRDIYLFDTFEGMTAPSTYDISVAGERAQLKFEKTKTGKNSSDWDYASLGEVRENVFGTGYDPSRFHFIKGRVEETLPEHSPGEIALLRLDTDFYESTKHELMYLYPRVVSGGIIIVDDYGHWKGAARAVDEFLAELPTPVFLNRIDFAARLIVKS